MVFLTRIDEAALVPELHAVGAGHIRDRRARRRDGADQVMIEAAADTAGHSGNQVRDLAALFGRPDNSIVVRAVDARLRVAVSRLEGSPSRFQQIRLVIGDDQVAC